jgi:hypothetical protein
MSCKNMNEMYAEMYIAVGKFSLIEYLIVRSLAYDYCHNGKGKAVPLQAWSGPEGSRKLRFPDYVTTAQDGGKVRVAQRVPGS